MPCLTREQILSSVDLKPEKVPVPEWGGESPDEAFVYVRIMTGTERDAFEGNWDSVKFKNGRSYLAVTTICDEQGNSLFNPDDVEALGKKSSAALTRVLDVCMRLNRLGAKDIEELEKNSVTPPSSASPAGPRHLSG